MIQDKSSSRNAADEVDDVVDDASSIKDKDAQLTLQRPIKMMLMPTTRMGLGVRQIRSRVSIRHFHFSTLPLFARDLTLPAKSNEGQPSTGRPGKMRHEVIPVGTCRGPLGALKRVARLSLQTSLARRALEPSKQIAPESRSGWFLDSVPPSCFHEWFLMRLAISIVFR